MNIDRTVKECTCCGDVIKILECTNESCNSYRDFALYKTSVNDGHYDKEYTWCYYMIIAEDSFPIVITEEVVNKILKDPEYGFSIATNWWFNRWR